MAIPNWVHLSDTEGTSGVKEVTVSVDENTGADRTAELTVSSGSLKKTLTVSQAKATGYVISLKTQYVNIYPADLDPTEFSYTVYKVDGESWWAVDKNELLNAISLNKNPRIYLSWAPIGSHDICDYSLKISDTAGSGGTVKALNPTAGDCLFTLQLNSLDTETLNTKRFNLKRAAFLLGSPIVELAWTEEGPVLYTLYQLQMAKGMSKLGIYLNMTEVQHSRITSFQMDSFNVCQSNTSCAIAQSEQLENAAMVTIRSTGMAVADGVTRVIPTDNDNMSSLDRWHPLKWYVENGNLYIWCLPQAVCSYNPEDVILRRQITVVTISIGTLSIANRITLSSDFYTPPEY